MIYLLTRSQDLLLQLPTWQERQKIKERINKNSHSGIMTGRCTVQNTYVLWSPYFSKIIYTHYIYLKKTLYLIKMITAFSFFKLSYPEGQLGWVLSPPSHVAAASFFPSLHPSPLSISLSLPPSRPLSLSLSVFPSLHCGSVNCSYSNIPSLPSPQLSFSQPLSCGIINLLVLSTCKSQTIEPYGAVWGAPLFIL